MAHVRCLHLLLQVLVMSLLTVFSVAALDFKYHDQESIEMLIKDWSNEFPNLTHVYSVGKSIRGEDLWVIAIGLNAFEHSLLVPNVKYVGNMHGNEVVGRELLLHLAEYMLLQYGKNETLTHFMNTTHVHIMPTMNPDGYASSREGGCTGVLGRGNALGYDLNRNFPDVYGVNVDAEQKETELVKAWIHSMHFVLSANFHGGAMLVNYPFDSFNGGSTQKYSATPDDDVFKHLALTYSRSHPTMHNGHSCGEYFPDGITNGAEWYPVLGGMQDYMYRNASGYEILVEMSCCKYPKEALLRGFWERNKDALINLMFAVHMGVKGLIFGQLPDSGKMFLPLEGAEVVVKDRESIIFRSTRYGEYFKLLLPGVYVLKVSYPGYLSAEKPFNVHESQVTRLDIYLYRIKYSEKPSRETQEYLHDGSFSSTARVTKLILVLLACVSAMLS